MTAVLVAVMLATLLTKMPIRGRNMFVLFKLSHGRCDQEKNSSSMSMFWNYSNTATGYSENSLVQGKTSGPKF